MISAKFLWGNVLLGGRLQIGAKNSNFDTFESALYMKSLSMPLIPNLRLQGMHDYVHWHCPIDYCVKLILLGKNLCENCSFHTEMISP